MKISPEGLSVVSSVRKSFVDALNALAVAVNETPDVDVAAKLAFVGDGVALFEKLLLEIERGATGSQLAPYIPVPALKAAGLNHVPNTPADEPCFTISLREDVELLREDVDATEAALDAHRKTEHVAIPLDAGPSAASAESPSSASLPTRSANDSSEISQSGSSSTTPTAIATTDGLCGAEFAPGRRCTLDKDHREICEGEPHRPECLCRRCNAKRGLVEVAHG